MKCDLGPLGLIQYRAVSDHMIAELVLHHLTTRSASVDFPNPVDRITLGGGLRMEFKLNRQAFLAAAGVGVMTTSFSELQTAVAQQATGGALR